MRARTALAAIAGVAVMLVVSPAAAKGFIAEANISGPGLGRAAGSSGGGGGVMRLEAPAAEGMWESGVLDDRKHDSLSELGLAGGDLGARYLVAYRFEFGPGTEDQVIRQELYPYAEGGPVTYTLPGQEQTGEEDLTGMGMRASIPSGWFRTNSGFFQYLVEHGLPATDPVAAAPIGDGPAHEPIPDRETRASWPWVAVGALGLAAASLAGAALRRRQRSVA